MSINNATIKKVKEISLNGQPLDVLKYKNVLLMLTAEEEGGEYHAKIYAFNDIADLRSEGAGVLSLADIASELKRLLPKTIDLHDFVIGQNSNGRIVIVVTVSGEFKDVNLPNDIMGYPITYVANNN